MGKNLPSVVAGTPYRIWHRGAWSDFSDVGFPQDLRNCTKCHSASNPNTPQGDNWKNLPGRAAWARNLSDTSFALSAAGADRLASNMNEHAICR